MKKLNWLKQIGLPAIDIQFWLDNKLNFFLLGKPLGIKGSFRNYLDGRKRVLEYCVH